MALVTGTATIASSTALKAEYLSGNTLLYPLKAGGYPTIVARTDAGALPATYDGLPQTYLEAYTALSETYPRIKPTDASVMLFRIHSTCDDAGGWTIDEVAIYKTDGTRLGIATGLAIAAVDGDQVKIDVEVDITSAIVRYAVGGIPSGGFTPQYAQWLAYRSYLNPAVASDSRDFDKVYVSIGSGAFGGANPHTDLDRALDSEIMKVEATAGDLYTEFCAGDTYIFTGRFPNTTSSAIDVYEVGLLDAQGSLLWRYSSDTLIGTIAAGDTGVVPFAWTTVAGKLTDKNKNLNPKV